MVEKSRTKIIEVCACDCLMCEECEGFEDAGAFRNKEVAEQVAQELAEEERFIAIANWNRLTERGRATVEPAVVGLRFQATAVGYIARYLSFLSRDEKNALIAKVARW